MFNSLLLAQRMIYRTAAPITGVAGEESVQLPSGT
jgi:hypothetical protein